MSGFSGQYNAWKYANEQIDDSFKLLNKFMKKKVGIVRRSLGMWGNKVDDDPYVKSAISNLKAWFTQKKENINAGRLANGDKNRIRAWHDQVLNGNLPREIKDQLAEDVKQLHAAFEQKEAQMQAGFRQRGAQLQNGRQN